MALLNPGGAIAQFQRNDCSILPVKVIRRGGVRKEWPDSPDHRFSAQSDGFAYDCDLGTGKTPEFLPCTERDVIGSSGVIMTPELQYTEVIGGEREYVRNTVINGIRLIQS